MKQGDIVEILGGTGFSTINRKGWKCMVLQMYDEKGDPYLAVLDKLGVSWPLREEHVKYIGFLWDMI